MTVNSAQLLIHRWNCGTSELSAVAFPTTAATKSAMLSLPARCSLSLRSHSSAASAAMGLAVPTIDLAGLHGGPRARSLVIDGISNACRERGFFQVINHGISQSITDGALDAAREFFELPVEEKMELTSDDVTRPVRYNKCQFQRCFLKHYAHPLEEWIHMWPSKPPEYGKRLGKHTSQVRILALEVMEAIMEGLGLGRNYLRSKLQEGLQVMAINGYQPAGEKPELLLGMAPHSDYSIITVLLQSFEGLEELHPESNSWNLITEHPGSLLVHGGNYLEVLSNGQYKSAVHRVSMKSNRMRVSIASLHSLAMDEKVEVAEKLVDENHPRLYRESTFRDFLEFLSENSGLGVESNYLDRLKIVPELREGA